MACTDDDVVTRKSLFSFRFLDEDVPIPMAAVTEADRMRVRLSDSKWHIECHYLPFKYDRVHPVGCTRTHAMAVLQTEDEYTPVVMHLVHQNMLRPSQCVAPSREFVSPWRRYAESFVDYIGGGAFENRLCIVLRCSVIVMTTEWRVVMRDNTITLQTLVACTMNNKYLVIVGVETGSTVQSLFIYDMRMALPRRVFYRRDISPAVRSLNLLSKFDSAMLIQCENGRTRRVEITEIAEPPYYTIKDAGDIHACSATERPSHTKELPGTSRIVQLVGGSFVLVKSKEDIDRSYPGYPLIIDVIDYDHGFVVSHDSDNTVRFFTSQLEHVACVPWESIAAGALTYESGVPSILRPYASLSRCLDAPDIVALLSSFGALVVIKAL